MTDISDIEYKEFTVKEIGELRPMYELRPNKSCDSAPLTCFVYKEEYKLYYFYEKDRALTLMFEDRNGDKFGFIPYCDEKDIAEYFRLQEQYYNEVLGIPLVIYSADCEGVSILQKAGMLDNYVVEDTQDLKDYIYDAETLRTLSGRKMTKKRNHVNAFLREYEGRWEYRTLSYDNKDDIIEFEESWLKSKLENESSDGYAKDRQDLLGEKTGIESIVSVPELYDRFKIGGIYIDGKLKAFSIGDYNKRQKMAIISIEKADGNIRGLYQIINREFLLHEFPDAVIVNREDDVGIEGLRKAKMSYHPVEFESKFTLRQKIRFLKKEEHARTIPLFRECFGDDEEFIREYYGQDNGKRIAVMEDENGNIISMAHTIRCRVKYENGSEEEVSYILCVATGSSYWGKGYMHDTMRYVMNKLKQKGEPWCFLIAVDKKIYQKLGFVHDWKLSDDELDILYADEGLDTASAALLNRDTFVKPVTIDDKI